MWFKVWTGSGSGSGSGSVCVCVSQDKVLVIFWVLVVGNNLSFHPDPVANVRGHFQLEQR